MSMFLKYVLKTLQKKRTFFKKFLKIFQIMPSSVGSKGKENYVLFVCHQKYRFA